MLAGLLLAAVTAPGPAFPAPGSYSYSAALNGQQIGRWSVAVKGADAGTEIDENSSASVMGMQLSAQADLMLSPDLSPTRYDGHYRTPNQSPNVSVSLTTTSATVVGIMTTQPVQVSLGAGTRHFVVIEPGLLAGLFALPAQLESWKDPAVTWITPTSAQAQVLTVGPSAPQKRPDGVSQADVLLSIASPIAVSIWYNPATLVPDRISVPSQNAVLTRVQ
ncbi:MAG TPA: hypothetical protein VGI19_12080 [Candidatus Cybelea sp.]|jgi:hypothetical protein